MKMVTAKINGKPKIVKQKEQKPLEYVDVIETMRDIYDRNTQEKNELLKKMGDKGVLVNGDQLIPTLALFSSLYDIGITSEITFGSNYTFKDKYWVSSPGISIENHSAKVFTVLGYSNCRCHGISGTWERCLELFKIVNAENPDEVFYLVESYNEEYKANTAKIIRENKNQIYVANFR